MVTGNTVIDALVDIANRPYEFADPLLERVGQERKLLLVTAHRRESFGEQLKYMCMAVRVTLLLPIPIWKLSFPYIPIHMSAKRWMRC